MLSATKCITYEAEVEQRPEVTTSEREEKKKTSETGRGSRLCLAQATWPAVSMQGFSVKKKEEDDVMEDWDLGE